jgi:hypothetical protein
MPGWDMITQTGAYVRELAFTRDDASRFMLVETTKTETAEAKEAVVTSVETVEGLAKVWHTVIEERLKWWTGDSD